ncbi:PspC domain-containing protein [Rhodococcus sp. NPDC058521]|uniref:PspC domain-containing protein n=1 Tax=Rhodococcus sp. NPDC058521 TaxID=3346536 RepID=UPI003659B4D4
MTNRSFQDQIGDLWQTRPVRLPRIGHVAGLCSGIGYRYNVDPVLVRVAFVVSTLFGGAGILLYLAGWLVLTRSGDVASATESMLGRGRSSESGTKTVVLLVALAIAVSTIGPFGVGMGGSGLISLLFMLAGLWFLYQRTPVPPPLPAPTYPVGAVPGSRYTPGPFTQSGPTVPQAYGPYTKLPDSYVPSEKPAPAPKQDPMAPTPAPQSYADRTQPTTVTTQPTQPAPPAWDPLGVAPFAWDLPEPAPTAPTPDAPERTRSRVTPTFIGLAILAAAAGAAVAVLTGSDWLTPGRIAALALATIGAGLLIGGLTRRGYGLLVAAGPLAGFVVLASMVGPLDFENVGEKQWAPVAADQLQSEYNANLGSFQLDLTGLELTEDTAVDITNRLGEFIVVVPPEMRVQTDCTTVMAESICLPDGVTGSGDGPVLTIDVDNQFGSVEVRRG